MHQPPLCECPENAPSKILNYLWVSPAPSQCLVEPFLGDQRSLPHLLNSLFATAQTPSPGGRRRVLLHGKQPGWGGLGSLVRLQTLHTEDLAWPPWKRSGLLFLVKLMLSQKVLSRCSLRECFGIFKKLVSWKPYSCKRKPHYSARSLKFF